MVSDILLITNSGAFGASPLDGFLEKAIRQIAMAASPDPNGEWAEKYGTDIDNNTFMMHHYCWCEEETCPWCAGCNCPDEAYEHFFDGKPVSKDDYYVERERLSPPMPHQKHSYGTPEYDAYTVWWEKEIAARNARFNIKHTPVCRYCTDGFSEHRGLPGRGAPNFLYKPTGFRVWWYKYIGRDMRTDGPETDLGKMLVACLEAAEKREE